MLNENREKIPVSDIKPIEDALAAAKEALKSDDMDKIRRGHGDAHQGLASPGRGDVSAGKEKQPADAPTEGGESRQTGAAGEGEVVDAEFEDLGKGKKYRIFPGGHAPAGGVVRPRCGRQRGGLWR